MGGCDQIEGDHLHPYQEVSQGQGEDQDVGGGVELLEVGDGDEDQHVEQHRHQRHDKEGGVDQDGLRLRKKRCLAGSVEQAKAG